MSGCGEVSPASTMAAVLFLRLHLELLGHTCLIVGPTGTSSSGPLGATLALAFWSSGVLAYVGRRCQDRSGKAQEACDLGVVRSLPHCQPRGAALGTIQWEAVNCPRRHVGLELSRTWLHASVS